MTQRPHNSRPARRGAKANVTAALAAVVAVVLALFVAPMASATTGTDNLGGVELMTTDGQHFSGDVPQATYVRYRAQGCGGCQKFVAIDASKMPFIARNISSAWAQGRPVNLTKANPAQVAANRKVVCLPSFPRPHGGQCDEYPFASSVEGGAGAQQQEVPGRENACQGGTIRAAYRREGIADGERYVVIIFHTEDIAPGPFTGIDIAKDKRTCPT